MSKTRAAIRTSAAWMLAASLVGCGSMPVLPGLGKSTISQTVIREHQERFQQDHDPQALNWLLANCVENGMTVSEVEQALGDAGQREEKDTAYKTKGGDYRTSDEGYRWGPDRTGRSVLLFFRDGALVNFDAADFKQQ